MSKNEIFCFDISKNEKFQLTDSYKILHRKLKSNWVVEQNDVELKTELFQRINVLMLAGPQDRFTEEEFQALKDFLTNGGKLLVLLGKGGEQAFDTNINFFLEQYGIFINNDTVVRPQYYKTFHPEDCMISGGIVSESLWRFVRNKDTEVLDFDFSDDKYKVMFQYPFGATLNVTEQAHILLTTGPVVYPFNRALASFYKDSHANGGCILVLGSGSMWQDKYLQSNKTNEAILDFCLKILKCDDDISAKTDITEVEISETKNFTNLGFLVDLPKACLIDFIGTDNAANSQDIKQKFDMRLCMLSNRLLTDVMATYKQLRVKYEPLKIIKPSFEIPLPPFQLTTFAPIFCEPPGAQLELFDLDEVLSSPRMQLSQTTGKCIQVLQQRDPHKPAIDKDLDAYIRECGRITGITLDNENTCSAVDILHIAMQRIVGYESEN